MLKKAFKLIVFTFFISIKILPMLTEYQPSVPTPYQPPAYISSPSYVEGIRTSQQQKLENQIAEIAKAFGYKHANLKAMDEISQVLQKHLNTKFKEFKVTIPEFVGISDQTTKNILNKHNIDIENEWEKILEPLSMQDIENLNLNEPFLEKCLALSEKIEAEFANLKQLPPELQTLKKIILAAKQKNSRLMVRSTGKEDTKEQSNAGGNVSIANVNPDEKSVLNAIGKVVASYLSEKSLQQRKDAGDKTIFDDPFTPVLIQEMAGEELGGAKNTDDIPIGCVVYSQETEGKLGKGETIIQSAFGHNEYVVDAMGPLDTFYVKGENIVNKIIQPQTKRLVPVKFSDGSFGLEEKNNPESIQDKPTLDADTVLAIHSIIQDLQQFYGYPIDAELIYDPKTKTINIVQARPIVYSVKEEHEPTHLSKNFIKTINKDNLINIKSVSSPDGAVKKISDNTEIIFAQNLNDALKTFLAKPKEDMDKVEMVLVTKNASVTSHPGAIFRGAGIVIAMGDNEGLKEYLDENNSLLVDTQQEKIIKIDSHGKEIDTLIQDKSILPGYITYPIPLQATVIPTLTVEEMSYLKMLPGKKMDDLISIVKSGSFQETQDALTTIISVIQENIRKKINILEKQPLDTQTKVAINNLQLIVNNLLDMEKSLNKAALLKPNSKERLFLIKPLEALIYQQESADIVGGYSLKNVIDKWLMDQKFINLTLKPLIQQKKISDKLLSNPGFFHFAEMGADQTYTDEFKNEWITFVDSILQSNDAEQTQQFFYIMQTVEKLGIMPQWININFSAEIRKKENPEKTLDKLNTEIK
ncbi:MAG: PEP/pyruvate-binding domain-containing protein, partial [bacterium]